MIEVVLEQFQKRAADANPIGGIIKFQVDDNAVFIDGSGDTNQVSLEGGEADCTITTSLDVLTKLKAGELNPMMAVMSGKIKISGDMGLAMKLQSLI